MSTRSLANSLLDCAQECCITSNAYKLHPKQKDFLLQYENNQTLCENMCYELGCQDLASMRHFLGHGFPSTQHRLQLVSTVHRLIREQNPVALFKTGRALDILLPSFLHTQQEYKFETENRLLRGMFYHTSDVCRAVHAQLGTTYVPSDGNALAYQASSSESQEDRLPIIVYTGSSISITPFKSDFTLAYHNSNSESQEDRMPIVFDTVCSISITPIKSDFIGSINPSPCENIKGVGDANHTVEGIGLTEWSIYDMNDNVFTIRCLAYYMPPADVRLFSPHTYFDEIDCNYSLASVYRRRVSLYLRQLDRTFEFPCHLHNNIPYMFPANKQRHPIAKHVVMWKEDQALVMSNKSMSSLFSVVDETNQKITAPKRSCCLGIRGFVMRDTIGSKP